MSWKVRGQRPKIVGIQKDAELPGRAGGGGGERREISVSRKSRRDGVDMALSRRGTVPWKEEWPSVHTLPPPPD